MLYKSAGLVPVRITEQGPEFLMLRAWNYWDFPKGKVDDTDMDFIQTALREADEEAGIKEVDFPWGKQYVETEAYKTKVEGKSAKKIARYYVAEYKSGEICILPNPETGVTEHEEFRWMTFDQIMDDLELSPRILAVLNWAKRIIDLNTRKCSKCKLVKKTSSFTPRPNRKSGFYSSCKECKNSFRQRRHRERKSQQPIVYWAQNAKNWTKDRAKSSGIVHTISVQDILNIVKDCNRQCTYCGIDVVFNNQNYSDRNKSASLDQILPKKGYLKENLTLSCYRCNQIKSDASFDELYTIARITEKLVKEMK